MFVELIVFSSILSLTKSK